MTSIRTANAADLDDIVEVFLGCWCVSYAGVMPPSLVESMSRARARALWQRVLEEADPGEVIVAESDAIVGVTRWAVDPTTGNRPPEGAVHSLYVAPAAQGSGVGTRLLAAASERMIAAGVGTARLWVFRDNAPSIGFYRRCGWLPDGATRVQDEFGEPEIRLSKALDR